MANDLVFQILCSTSTWKAPGIIPNTFNLYFNVFQSFTLNTNINTHVLQSFLLNTNINTHVLQTFSLNTNIKYSCAPDLLTQRKTSHQLCASVAIPNTWNHIFITYVIGLCSIYQTNHHVHVQWGLMPNIENKTSKQQHKQCSLCP